MPSFRTGNVAGADVKVASPLRRSVREESINLPREIVARSHRRAALSVVTGYTWIAVAVLAGRALDGSVLAVVAIGFVAIVLAQRSLQTLVHHLAHDLLSRNRRLNDQLGNWLVAGLVGMRVQNYRRVHFIHHAQNGSAGDPEFIDFTEVRARGGLLRYMVHYAVGGEMLFLIKKYYAPKRREPTTLTSRSRDPARSGPAQLVLNMAHVLVAQAVLVALFAVIAHAWYLFVIWLYVAVTWSPMISKLRFLVEHPGRDDRTVTTLGPWYQILVFAPFQFNYHFEHHVWPSAPPYQLRRIHQHLIDTGFFERHPENVTPTFVGALRRGAAAIAVTP